MKKRFLGILAAALLLLPGCAGGKEPAADVKKLSDQLVSTIKFKDEMSAAGTNAAVKLYGLETEDVAQAGVYESTGATAEEVAAFQAKDGAAAARIKQKVGERVETQRAGFRDYQPGEMEKLKNPVIVAKGSYVILCVSDDNAKAKEIIDSQLK